MTRLAFIATWLMIAGAMSLLLPYRNISALLFGVSVVLNIADIVRRWLKGEIDATLGH